MNTENKTNTAATQPSAKPAHQTPELISQPLRYTHQIGPVPEQDSPTYIKEGKSSVITVNTPFTVIPGLPALNKILAKFDKTTQQDLGFTFKANTIKTLNQQGEQDLLVNVDYIGFGLMSSKFNVQFSPVSVKIESGEFNSEPHWGCNMSVLSSPIGLVHERVGMKGTFSDCSSARSFSAAPEFSYQSSNTFRPLSTATGGYYFGDSGTFRIPSEYVPTLERIKSASPSTEEWEIMADHIAPAIPAIPIGSLINHGIDAGGSIIESTKAIAESAVTFISKYETDSIDTLHKFNPSSSQPHQQTFDLPIPAQVADTSPSVSTQFSTTNNHYKTTPEIGPKENQQTNRLVESAIEEKAHYTVQNNDSLAIIAKKTGYSWPEIYALNKNILKNNPDRIYPGQELLIPEHHAALINNPVVQAQILANLTKHYSKQALENDSNLRN